MSFIVFLNVSLAVEPNIFKTNNGKHVILFHLDGCLHNRYNHSIFQLLQIVGARFTTPANTSKLPPTPIKMPFSNTFTFF